MPSVEAWKTREVTMTETFLKGSQKRLGDGIELCAGCRRES